MTAAEPLSLFHRRPNEALHAGLLQIASRRNPNMANTGAGSDKKLLRIGERSAAIEPEVDVAGVGGDVAEGFF